MSDRPSPTPTFGALAPEYAARQLTDEHLAEVVARWRR